MIFFLSSNRKKNQKKTLQIWVSEWIIELNISIKEVVIHGTPMHLLLAIYFLKFDKRGITHKHQNGNCQNQRSPPLSGSEQHIQNQNQLMKANLKLLNGNQNRMDRNFDGCTRVKKCKMPLISDISVHLS